ncbi:MAG: response regulator transcription factor [Solirubrobacteraceae bacterium]|nr:MAG: DNA-binding response regulator [Solirubrobacterales bacterium]
MRVLIAEDEPRVADAIARGLRREGMAVDVARDGASALLKARVIPYDVVVLDRDLPEVHGDEVCRTLTSERPDTRVIMLTASNGLVEVVDGLSLGADDYMVKPFAFAELVARLRALERRANPARPVQLVHGELTVDPGRHEATRAERTLSLTPKEFGVLEILVAARGAVVTSEQLLERVWDENADPFTNAVRVTMMTLRRKLGPPPTIHTVVGVGYRL